MQSMMFLTRSFQKYLFILCPVFIALVPGDNMVNTPSLVAPLVELSV